MTEQRVIYAGPSLYGCDLPPRLRAALRPPVRHGDLSALPGLADGGWDITIIDGEFGQSLAITVTEIRTALEAGNTVRGCASMGALRAAECAPIGMRGSGWVYDAYASGRIDGDDEVALLYEPASYEPLTVPAVNVRWVATRLVDGGELSEQDAEAAVEATRDVFFRARTLPALHRTLSALAGSRPRVAALLRALDEERAAAWDRKRLDALDLVGALA